MRAVPHCRVHRGAYLTPGSEYLLAPPRVPVATALHCVCNSGPLHGPRRGVPRNRQQPLREYGAWLGWWLDSEFPAAGDVRGRRADGSSTLRAVREIDRSSGEPCVLLSP